MTIGRRKSGMTARAVVAATLVAASIGVMPSRQAAAVTVEGPELLGDLNLDPLSGAFDVEYFEDDGRWWFEGNDGVHGGELWVSDGTTGGTRMVADLNPTGDANPDNLTYFDGHIYFTATDGGGTYGYELWRSDGTSVELVEDVRPGVGGGLFFTDPLHVFDGHLYFVGDDGSSGTGNQLWRTDGTTTEPFYDPVDNGESSRDGDPDFFATVEYAGGSSAMFFRAWVNDGVLDGFQLLAIRSGDSEPEVVTSGSAYNLVPAGPALYYVDGQELYRVVPDAGTPSTWGASLVGGERVGEVIALPPANSNGVVALISGSAGISTDLELYVVPDHSSAPILVKDINGTTSGSSVSGLYARGDRVFFAANDGVNGSELWMSDAAPGSTDQTLMVADIFGGPSSSSPRNMVGAVVAGEPTIFFRAASSPENAELWRYEVGNDVIANVADIEPAGPSNPSALVVGDGGALALFTAYTQSLGTELYAADLATPVTPAGVTPVLLKDVNPTTEDSAPEPWTDFGDRVVWTSSSTDADALMAYDPSTGVTSTLFETDTGYMTELVALGDQLLFSKYEPATNTELWASDGTPLGTGLLADIAPDGDPSYPAELTVVGDVVIFSAEGPDGDEPWATDGTTLGTVQLADLAPGPDGSFPTDFVESGGVGYFTAEVAGTRSLYRTDGTPGGTSAVLPAVGTIDDVSDVTPYLDGVLFEGDSRLWFSDGTPSGTVRHDTADDGVEVSSIERIVVNGDRAFFFGDLVGDSDDGRLWTTGPTVDSTVALRAHEARGTYGDIVAFRDGSAIAVVDDSDVAVLVVTDGTVAGTDDLLPPVAGTNPEYDLLGEINGEVLLIASTPANGRELWRTNGSTFVPLPQTRPGLPSSIDPERDVDDFRLGDEFFISGDQLFMPMATMTSLPEPHVITVSPDVPAPPTGVTATLVAGPSGLTEAVTTGSVEVAWAASPDVYAAPVTSYTATAAPGGATCTTSTTSCVIDGLTPGVTYTFTATATNRAGTSASSAASAAVVIPSISTPPPPIDAQLDAAARFVPVSPVRLFDTRPAEAAPGPKGKVQSESSIDVQVHGQVGIPDDAVAVVLNVTVTETEAPGFVTVYPKGAPLPNASNVNILTPGQTRPNLVTVPIGDDGQVSFYAFGTAHVLADVAGYYVDQDADVAAGRFVPLTPQRLFDTRPGEAAPGPKGKLASEQTIDVQTTGVGDVPATGVAAVVINITATEATAPGFVTAFPKGESLPTASNVNFSEPGATAPNLAIVPIGDDGQVSFYSFGGTHLLGDVTGYITDDSVTASTAGLFVPLDPVRVFDTREEEAPAGPKGYVPADSSIDAQVAGAVGIPADAGAVVLNVTGVASPIGFITVWPTGIAMPTASTLNFAPPSDVRANAAMVPVGAGGQISFYTFGGADILADTAGYFLP